MSFSFSAAGLVSDAIGQVEAVTMTGENPQFEAVRDFVLAQLENWPTNANSPKGVFVEASGHSDAYTQNLSLTIRPLYIRLPEGDA